MNQQNNSTIKPADIIRSGFLMKRSKFLKQWRDRWIILTYSQLITFTDKSCKQITQKIYLTSVQAIKSYVSKQEKNSYLQFNIKTKYQSYRFSTQNIQEKWSWIVTLERLLHLRNNGTTSYNNYVFINSKGFDSVNQYLHKNNLQQNADKLNIIQTAKILQNSHDSNKKELLKQKIKVKKSFAEIQKQKQMLQIERQIINNKMQILNHNNIEILNMEQINSKQIEKNQITQKRQILVLSILNQFQYKSIGLQNACIFIDFIIKIYYKDQFGFKQVILKIFKQYHDKARKFIQGLIQIMTYSKNLGMTSFLVESLWIKQPQLYLQQQIPIILQKLLVMLFSLKNLNNYEIVDLTTAIYTFNKINSFKYREEVDLKLKKIENQTNNLQAKSKIQKILKRKKTIQ